MKIFYSRFKKIYKKIIGEEATDNVLSFFKNLEYAAIGYGIAGFCVFLFGALTGRILGPHEYGKYVLVSIIGLFVYLFMTLGINTAAIKYSVVGDESNKKKIISTAYFLIILFSFFWGIFFWIFSDIISSFLSVSSLIFRLSIILAIFFSLYIISTDTLRALYKIKILSFFRAIYGLLIIALLILSFLTNHISFQNIVFIICFSYFIIFLLITINVKKYLSFGVSKLWAKSLLSYGSYAAIGGLLFTFLPTLSQMFVNKYMATKDVGIYSAYYFSSINIMIFLYNIFIVVFFPTVSKHQQGGAVLKKLKKIIPFLFLIGVPMLLIMQFVAFKIYGSQYPMNFYLMILFALSSVLISIYGLYCWFFYSTGVAGAKRVAVFTTIIFICNFLLNFYLVPIFFIWGAIIATCSTYIIGILCLLLFPPKNNNQSTEKKLDRTIKICHIASADITVKFILLNLLKFLQHEGYEVSVICSGGKWVKDIEEKGIRIKEIRFKRKIFSPISDVVAFLKLYFYFRKEKPDIVHTHTIKAGFLGQIAAKLAGVPIIIHTNHGFYFQNNSSWMRRKFFIFIEKKSSQCSNLIFSINKEDIETAIKKKICAPDLIKYSGDGIDLNRFSPQRFSEEFILNKKKQLGIDPKKKIIGIVARLVEEKGYLDLFEAFRIILKKFPQTLLLIVGPYEPEKKDKIHPEIVKKYQIEKSVIFLGERTDVEEIYPLMDVFVLPSYREGLGLAILEASATEKPVIATNVRGCREAIDDGKTGILVPPKNPEKLAEAITYLFLNPEKANIMGKEGRKKVQREFDERLVFDKIKKEYQKLIDEKLK